MDVSVFWKLVGHCIWLQYPIIPRGEVFGLLLVAHLKLRLIGIVFKEDNLWAAFEGLTSDDHHCALGYQKQLLPLADASGRQRRFGNG